MDQFVFERIIMNHSITISIQKLKYGASVRIFGGQLSHIGAVSISDEEGKIHTITLPGHKETVICEEWAKDIYHIIKEPVCVEAGIHYDDLCETELTYIIAELNALKIKTIEIMPQLTVDEIDCNIK